MAGQGPRVVDLRIEGGGFCVFTIQVRGNQRDSRDSNGGNFAVWMVDPDRDLWVNEIGITGTWQVPNQFDSSSG